jgi:hypothetical protein
MTHLDTEARSLALHRLVAQKIQHDPALMNHVADNLARWKKRVCQNSQPYILAWEALLGQGLAACLRIATEDSEYANAMRQCSPFAGVLSPQERWQFLREWGKHEAP